MKTLPNEIFFAEVEYLLSAGERVVLTVQGNSMRPFIRSGRTKVVLAPCPTADLEVGDIVLFRYYGRHILHRIVGRTDDGFVLAGDGNYRMFEQCRREDIIARVVTVIGFSGRETDCKSRRWRLCSRIWTGLHPFVRRCILAVLVRAGIK